jgi:hypothetical protein
MHRWLWSNCWIGRKRRPRKSNKLHKRSVSDAFDVLQKAGFVPAFCFWVAAARAAATVRLRGSALPK